ncbi:YegS/Rv2252/BmrU family lipid kinase [Rhizobium daejeonense]|uniref:YegS/Rv2252/BmrU family lipid kinase n=1 Tax=Rhizobium daejeonense TaxID=240521 RepID=UPI00164679D5
MKTGVIRNPVSGGKAFARAWPTLLQALNRRFPDIDVRETTAAGQAAYLARELVDCGCELVIAVGGDGTVSDVVDGILSSSRPRTAFSLIPNGTGCDFARNFRLAKTPESIVNQIAAAPLRCIDVVRLSGTAVDGGNVVRHFANIASVGVSGEIVRSMNEAPRNLLMGGSTRFMLYSALGIIRYRPQSVRVVIDGEDVYAGAVTVACIANGAWFGGGMHVVPQADLTDGLLDVAVMRATSKIGQLGLLARLHRAAHVSHPLLSFHKGRTVEITPIGEGRFSCEADGENPGLSALRAEILPAGLAMRI